MGYAQGGTKSSYKEFLCITALSRRGVTRMCAEPLRDLSCEALKMVELA